MVRNPADEPSPNENGTEAQTAVLKSFENVCLVEDSEQQSAPGTLCIMHASLRWECAAALPAQSLTSWAVNFVDINLHAISTDASSGYPPSIYAQTGDDYKEVRMIPEQSRLQELYDALCEGVVRNEDSTSEDMGVLSMAEDASEQG